MSTQQLKERNWILNFKKLAKGKVIAQEILWPIHSSKYKMSNIYSIEHYRIICLHGPLKVLDYALIQKLEK